MQGRILNQLQSLVQRGRQRVAEVVSRCTKPSSTSLPLSTVADLARSKPLSRLRISSTRVMRGMIR